jgi:hypothetical protein
VIDTAEIDAGPIVEQVGTTVDGQLSVAEITSMLFQQGLDWLRVLLGKGASQR